MARQRPREPRATCTGHVHDHCDASNCGVDPSASTSVAFGTGLPAILRPSQLAPLDSWSGNQRRSLILVSAVAELFFPLLSVTLSQSLLGQHGSPQAWPRGCQKNHQKDDSQLISVCEQHCRFCFWRKNKHDPSGKNNLTCDKPPTMPPGVDPDMAENTVEHYITKYALKGETTSPPDFITVFRS